MCSASQRLSSYVTSEAASRRLWATYLVDIAYLVGYCESTPSQLQCHIAVLFCPQSDYFCVAMCNYKYVEKHISMTQLGLD